MGNLALKLVLSELVTIIHFAVVFTFTDPPPTHTLTQTVDFLIFLNMLGAVKMKRTSTYLLYDFFHFQISISLCRETGHKYRIWGVCKGVLEFTRN